MIELKETRQCVLEVSRDLEQYLITNNKLDDLVLARDAIRAVVAVIDKQIEAER